MRLEAFDPLSTPLRSIERRGETMGMCTLASPKRGMERAGADTEQLVHHDHAFHSTVFQAAGNRTLTSILVGLSSRTRRASGVA